MLYAGQETAVVELVDVSKIVAEMLDLLKISVSKRVALERDLGQDLPSVQASAAQVHQIVMNLVTNASDAIGPKEGVIRVSTRFARVSRCSPRTISSNLAEGDYVLLEVSDTGCGMSEATRTRIFDPFFTTKSTGRGLGLAVIDGIVRTLGGEVRVASELGKGTTFEILLPCTQLSSPQVVPNSAREETPVSRNRGIVLVVDDEDTLRQAVTKMLRKTGFEVLEAANGSAAIDVLHKTGSRIDVVLLDMTIPGASSAQVVNEYVKARPNSRVILTSAYSKEMATAAINSPQVHCFVRKPFQLGQLVKTIQNTMAS
jgi:CheY-like chemotaxis protein/two-component sensor histidine kinase